jgi:hypothetical protein
MLVERLSYTHLELLTGIADPLKRAFNELRFDRAREEDAGGVNRCCASLTRAIYC